MVKKGERYKCDSCGLIVLVEDECGCKPACSIVCCEEPMKKVVKKVPVKAAKKPVAKK